MWKDKWIPNLESDLVDHATSVGAYGDDNDTVAALLDCDTKWWNINEVRALFTPNIVDKILKIPVCPGTSMISSYVGRGEGGRIGVVYLV